MPKVSSMSEKEILQYLQRILHERMRSASLLERNIGSLCSLWIDKELQKPGRDKVRFDRRLPNK